MRHTPFERGLVDISPTDLSALRDVHEGWYVEYKSEVIKPRALAKSLSSFANQYGGLLFIGIISDSQTNVADCFPGVADSAVPSILESLRNAAKDLLHPHVFYTTRIFEGPIRPIGLKQGRSIIAVDIPQGADTPYVHNDGRIYVRIGDSSDPKPLTDRATFDILSQRGEQARLGLEDRIQRSPMVSKGEGEQPFVHFSILSDPYGFMGHWYDGNLTDFSKVMREQSLPLDNIFSKSDGYVARQTAYNDPRNRVFTWEFSRQCHSFVTLPIPVLSISGSSSAWSTYSTGQKFISMFNHESLESIRILDLNQMLDACEGIIKRHRILVDQANVRGPFYIKAYIENVWRTIPFLDLPDFISHISEFGLPIVQDDEIMTPDGTSLETFVVAPESSEAPEKLPPYVTPGSVQITGAILRALGIPGDTLMNSGTTLLELGRRRMEVQQSSRTTGVPSRGFD